MPSDAAARFAAKRGLPMSFAGSTGSRGSATPKAEENCGFANQRAGTPGIVAAGSTGSNRATNSMGSVTPAGPGTPGTPGEAGAGSGVHQPKSAENGHFSGIGTRGTPGTRENEDVEHAAADPSRTMVEAAPPAASRKLPVSWAQPTVLPAFGYQCSCCGGQRWWSKTVNPTGWCCWICHPPGHLPQDAVREVRT